VFRFKLRQWDQRWFNNNPIYCREVQNQSQTGFFGRSIREGDSEDQDVDTFEIHKDGIAEMVVGLVTDLRMLVRVDEPRLA
jgi:hypothetical protein